MSNHEDFKACLLKTHKDLIRIRQHKLDMLRTTAGPCGTGKSHIAQALGHLAVRAGYDVPNGATPSTVDCWAPLSWTA